MGPESRQEKAFGEIFDRESIVLYNTYTQARQCAGNKALLLY